MRKRLAAFLLLIILLTLETATGETFESVYRLVSEDEKIYCLGDTGWLIERWASVYDHTAAVKQAKSFNKVMSAFPSVKTYVFLINSSRSINMDDITGDPPIWKDIRDYYTGSKTDSLEIDSIETYQEYFYKTDHHWNYHASYLGYKQIIRMLLGKKEPIMKPLETVQFPFMFNGSYNRRLNRTDSDQAFTVYRFDYPEMTVKINGKRKKSYGQQEAYFTGKYSEDALTNHYGQFYGGDSGIVEFCTNQPEKENIIIISNSFSNAVSMLIASHFNHTWFIDMRYYNRDMKKDFNLKESIKAWKANKVLLLGDGVFFSSDITYR